MLGGNFHFPPLQKVKREDDFDSIQNFHIPSIEEKRVPKRERYQIGVSVEPFLTEFFVKVEKKSHAIAPRKSSCCGWLVVVSKILFN